MLCSVCGANVPEGSANCSNCGSPVVASAGPPSAQPSPPNQATLSGLPMPPVQPPTDGKATASLVLGILSLLCLGFLAGIPAVILGHKSRSAIRQSMGRLQGDGMALAGLIMGYAGSALSILWLIMFASMLAYLIPGFGSRVGSDQQQAASLMRSINASQATYAVTYLDRGFARDLASLGHSPSSGCPTTGTEEHACLLSNELGNPECTTSAWCTKGSYKFRMQGVDCKKNKCNSYLLVATPADGAGKSPILCSTDDMAIRAQAAGSSSLPTTVAECRSWPALLAGVEQ